MSNKTRVIFDHHVVQVFQHDIAVLRRTLVQVPDPFAFKRLWGSSRLCGTYDRLEDASEACGRLNAGINYIPPKDAPNDRPHPS